MAEHLVASTRGRDRSLTEAERGCCWLWHRLRRALPGALSCVVMPDHLHVVARPGGLASFRGVLCAFTVKFGVRFDVLDPEVANSPAIAGRMMRYGFRNAVVAGYVDDPWKWPLSTLRDLGGAAHPIWTPMPVVASLLQMAPEVAMRRLSALGDREPPLPRPEPIAVATVDAVISSVAVVLRVPVAQAGSTSEGRRLVVQACHAVSTVGAQRLADQLGVHERTVRRDRDARHPGLNAVLLCLGDARLRSWTGPPGNPDNSRGVGGSTPRDPSEIRAGGRGGGGR